MCNNVFIFVDFISVIIIKEDLFLPQNYYTELFVYNLVFSFYHFLANIYLKELEHRQLGWKVIIFKFDLGKSLSKEMWCKMADTKKYFDYIF